MVIVNKLIDENNNEINASQLVFYDNLNNSLKTMMNKIIVNIDDFDLTAIKYSLESLEELEAMVKYITQKQDSIESSLDFGDRTTMSEIRETIEDYGIKVEEINNEIDKILNETLVDLESEYDLRINEIELKYNDKIDEILEIESGIQSDYVLTIYKNMEIAKFVESKQLETFNINVIDIDLKNDYWLGALSSLRNNCTLGEFTSYLDGSSLDKCEYLSGSLRSTYYSKWNLGDLDADKYYFSCKTFDIENGEYLNLSIYDDAGNTVNFCNIKSTALDATYVDWINIECDLTSLTGSNFKLKSNSTAPGTMCDFWLIKQSEYELRYSIDEIEYVISEKSRLPLTKSKQVFFNDVEYNPLIWSNFEGHNPLIRMNFDITKTIDFSCNIYVDNNAVNNNFKISLGDRVIIDSSSQELVSYDLENGKLYFIDLRNIIVGLNEDILFTNDISENILTKQIGVCNIKISESSYIVTTSTNPLIWSGLNFQDTAVYNNETIYLLTDSYNTVAESTLDLPENKDCVFTCKILFYSTLDPVDYCEISVNGKVITTLYGDYNENHEDWTNNIYVTDTLYATNLNLGFNDGGRTGVEDNFLTLTIPFKSNASNTFKLNFVKNQASYDEEFAFISSSVTYTDISETISEINDTYKSGRSSTNWKIYDEERIYIDINTDCFNIANVQYFTSLEGISKHYKAQGIDNLYNETSNGFRIYLKYTDDISSTELLQLALDNQWIVSWIAIGAIDMKGLSSFAIDSFNYELYDVSKDLTTNLTALNTLNLLKTYLLGSVPTLIIKDTVTKDILNIGHNFHPDDEYFSKVIIKYYGKIYVPNSGQYSMNLTMDNFGYVEVGGEIINILNESCCLNSNITLNLVSGYNDINIYVIDTGGLGNFRSDLNFEILYDTSIEDYKEYDDSLRFDSFKLIENGKSINYSTDVLDAYITNEGYDLFCPHTPEDYEAARQYLLKVNKPLLMGPLGIYNNSVVNSANKPLNSANAGNDGWIVRDGSSEWWASDLTSIPEPNGDYTPKSYLKLYYDSNGIIYNYNDTTSGTIYDSYLVVKRNIIDNREILADILEDGSCTSYYPLKYDTGDLLENKTLVSHNMIYNGVECSTQLTSQVSSYIEVLNTVDLSGELTMQYMVKNQYSDTNNRYHFSCASTVTDNELILNIDGSILNSSNETITNSELSILDNEWHLVTLSFNNKSIDIYVDNTLVRSNITNTDCKIIMGQEQDTFGGSFESTQCFIGLYKEFRFFNKSLTSDEVALCVSKLLEFIYENYIYADFNFNDKNDLIGNINTSEEYTTYLDNKIYFSNNAILKYININEMKTYSLVFDLNITGTNTYTHIFTNNNDQYNYTIKFYTYTDSSNIGICYNGISENIIDIKKEDLNNLIVTSDENSTDYYVNGELICSKSPKTIISGDYISGQWITPTNSIENNDFSLNNFKLYNKKLSSLEVFDCVSKLV